MAIILNKASIKNFRSIRSLDVDFHPNFTVFIGRNGVGKTSLLDALSLLLVPVLSLWSGHDGRKLFNQGDMQNSDVKHGEKDFSLAADFSLCKEFKSPVKLKSEASYLNRSLFPPTDSVRELWSVADKIKEKTKNRPLFVYYKQSRGFGNTFHSNDLMNSETVYHNSVTGNLRVISDLENWWDKRDADEARVVRDKDQDYRDPQLQSIRNLIKNVDSFSDILFSSSSGDPGLYLRKRADDSLVHVNKLSSGERSYVILLSDLARRLQMLHPSKTLDRIPGIVLIDEVELNLHPAWQSEIIQTLRQVFKSCQIIVTTHSPQVISALGKEHVRILKNVENGNVNCSVPLSTKGRTSNYLLESVFGASTRFPPVEELIYEFNTSIDNGDAKNAETLLNTILDEVEGEPPEIIVLKKRLKKLVDRNERK